MPLSLQAKLLRVLEERVYEKVGSGKPLPAEFRVIPATHRDLAQLVRQGTFREDLYHRINVVPIAIPPLRERREDIPLLVEFKIGGSRGVPIGDSLVAWGTAGPSGAECSSAVKHLASVNG